MMIKSLVIICSTSLLIACSDQAPDQFTENTGVDQVEDIMVLKSDPARYTKGLALYQQTCAACHGNDGQGAANWQKRDAQGKYKAPPLNGTAHTWHHPQRILTQIIRNGTQRIGGSMPAWKDTLSDTQIDDVLYWIKSQWPNEIYNAWYRNNEEALKKQTQKEKK